MGMPDVQRGAGLLGDFPSALNPCPVRQVETVCGLGVQRGLHVAKGHGIGTFPHRRRNGGDVR